MNQESVTTLYPRLRALTVFRGITSQPIVKSLLQLLCSVESMGEDDLDKQLDCYGDFVSAVYAEGGNLSTAMRRIVLEDENFYIVGRARGHVMAPEIEAALAEELQLLQEVSQLTPQMIKEQMKYDGFLADWVVSDVDIPASYANQIENIASTGYGIFAKYNGFTVKNGHLVPIRSMDTQTLESLYGYQRERNMVLENTRALVEGGKACNVLLYGDAGTGKSSTIKAAARHFFDKGLRIVEFKKDQLDDILPIMEFLSEIPLKFIFYIDDLSFAADDDSFCALKGILEGSAASYAGNIAIYATSNRRHLIKESMEDRVGDSLHVNETMQETMSLSARFGLSITFSKPEKDLYLEIVKNLAKDYGVDLPEDELFRRAEAFAIRQNGRSPRTAKQFLQLAKIGLK